MGRRQLPARCRKKTGIDVQAPGCRLTDWGWRTITTSGPSGATAMRLTSRNASGCLACASLLRCPVVPQSTRTRALSVAAVARCCRPGFSASNAEACLWFAAFVGGGWRLTLWLHTSDSWGTAVSVGAQTKFVEGICRVGWRLFAVCAEVCVPARPARKRCWAAMSLSAERARVRMTTPPGCRSLSCPRTAFVGGYAAAFTQCVNFLLKGF